VVNQVTQSGYISRLFVVVKILFLLVALASFIYAVVTAPFEGKDLAYFQDIGRAWAAGIYQTGEGGFYGQPPFTAVLFSPLAVLYFEQSRVIFIGLNLVVMIRSCAFCPRRFSSISWCAKFFPDWQFSL